MELTQVIITDIENVGKDTIAIDLETPSGFSAEPGQFIQIGMEVDGELIVRHYTISSPYVDDSFEVTIEIDPEGELTPRLRGLEIGDELGIDGPFGRVYYQGEEYPVVLAGGPGIGPAIGIAERALDEGNHPAVLYSDDSPVHRDRLERLMEEDVPVKILDGGLEGLDFEPLDNSSAEVFIYGFSDFVDSVLEITERYGLGEGRVKVERFD